MPLAANDDAIRQRAYEIWLMEGQPDGQEQDHWFRAESEFGGSPDEGDAMNDTGADSKQRGRADG